MPPAISSTEAQELRRLIPLNTMPVNRFDALCAKVRVESADKGTAIIRQGDTRNELVYLLSGTVGLQAGDMELDKVSSDSDSARFALAQQLPRKVSVVAKTPVRFVRIDAALVKEEPQPLREPAKFAIAGESEPEESECDWMAHLLRSPLFQRLPPTNLQALIRTVREIRVPSGAVICRQDDPGDYYYIIKKGQCLLTRKPTRNAKEIKLAVLKTCDTFGEDALISEKPRTVTVTMLTEGKLLRIEKSDFLRLIRDPVIVHLASDAAMRMIRDGAVWLDVRLPDAYGLGHARGSVNAPFFSLRMTMSSLNRQNKYILLCEDSKISDAAAFLLIRHGFDAYVLRDGIESLPRDEWEIDTAGVSKETLLGGELPVAGESPETAVDQTEPPEAAPETDSDEAPATAADTEQGADAAIEPVADSAVELPVPLPVPESTTDTPITETPAAPSVESAPAGDPVWELRQALAHSEAERKRAQQQVQTLKTTTDRLEAALQSIQEEYEQVLESRAAPDRPGTGATFPAADESRRLREQAANATREKETLTVEAESLRRKVAELQDIVKGFLERTEGSEETRDDESDTLRTELKTVYRQAEKDMADLQRLIVESEARNTSLQTELRTIRQQMAVREAAYSAHAADEAARAQLAARQRRWLLPALAGFGAAILLCALLTGIDPVRAGLRAWLNAGAPDRAISPPNDQAANPPATPAPPPTPSGGDNPPAETGE